LTAEAKTLYEKYPMWQFYRCGSVFKRVFGTLGTDRLQTMTLLSMFPNETLGGTQAETLTSFENYEEGELDRLQSPLYSNVGWFTDPLGFLAILEAKR
jgi:hypothetical protein